MDTTASATPAGSLTRAAVAMVLGISVAGVRRREARTLHPIRGPKGECLFDPGEVETERQRMLAESKSPPMPVPTQPGTSGSVGESEPVVPEKTAVPLSTSAPALIQGRSEPGAAAVPATPSSKPESDGVVAAEVFGLFSDGKSPVEAVIATKLGPSVVARFYEDWQRLQAMDISSTGARCRIDELAAAVAKLETELKSRQQDDATRAGDFTSLDGRVGAIEYVLVQNGLGVMRERDTDSAKATA